MERLQKILSARGAASRRKAEEMISQGRVTVNGVTACLGDTADPERDDIRLDGRPLPQAPRNVYILLNKPRGYVTTLSDEKGRPNAAQLVADCGVRVYPVGRLDMDSEGLLLFTNDGEFANALMHPRHETQKTYEVWVEHYVPGGCPRGRKAPCPPHYPGRLHHSPAQGLSAKGRGGKGKISRDHPRGQEPSDTPDVSGGGHDLCPSATHSGGGLGAGRPAPGKMAVSYGGRDEKTAMTKDEKTSFVFCGNMP